MEPGWGLRRCVGQSAQWPGSASGIVAKNGILLLDANQKFAHANFEPEEAMVQAGRRRLRPIFMTALATMAGMLPLAFEIGSGAEFRAPMARAVIGGLITSTLLTLVVVPVVYTYLDDAGARFVRWWGHGVKELEPKEPVHSS